MQTHIQWIDDGVRVWLFFLFVLMILVFDYVILVPYWGPFFWALMVCVFLRRVHHRLVAFVTSIVPSNGVLPANSTESGNASSGPTTTSSSSTNSNNSNNDKKKKANAKAKPTSNNNAAHANPPTTIAWPKPSPSLATDESVGAACRCGSPRWLLNFLSIFWSLFKWPLLIVIVSMSLLVLLQATLPAHIASTLLISNASPILFLKLYCGLAGLIFLLSICLLVVPPKTLVSVSLIFCFVFGSVYILALFVTKCSAELAGGALDVHAFFNKTLNSTAQATTDVLNFALTDPNATLKWLSISPDQVESLFNESRAVLMNWATTKFGELEMQGSPILLELGQRAIVGAEVWLATHVTPLLSSGANSSHFGGALSEATALEILYFHWTNETLDVSSITASFAADSSVLQRIGELVLAILWRSVDPLALGNVAAGWAGQIFFVTLSSGLVLIRESIYQFASVVTFLGVCYVILESEVDPLEILAEIIPGDTVRRRVHAKSRAYVHGLFVSTMVIAFINAFCSLLFCFAMSWRFAYLTTLCVGIMTLFPIVPFIVAFIPMMIYISLSRDFGWLVFIYVFIVCYFLGYDFHSFFFFLFCLFLSFFVLFISLSIFFPFFF
jgi:predicted PurR-regulated permease PerM